MRTFAASLGLLVLLGCGAGGTPTAISFALVDNVGIGLSGGDFCCDPKKQPQVIATIRISNNLEEADIIVAIGPFSNGVRTEDGAKTSKTLRPGEVLDTKILSTRCDWTMTEGPLVITGPGESLPGVVETRETIERTIRLENKCPAPKSHLDVGLEVSGLARAHYTQDDPPTAGTNPFLYVTGADMAVGIEVYALGVDTITKKIVNAAKMAPVMIPAKDGSDIVPVSAGAGPGLTRALYLFPSFGRTHWNGMVWGAVRALTSPVRDIVSYGGGSRAPGVSYVRGASVFFEEHVPTSNQFNGTGDSIGGQVHFPNATGTPVSSFVDKDGRGVIVVMDGSPGQIWFHARGDFNKPATLVGVAGNDPRKVRAKNGLVAISNYGSDSITLLTWNGTTAPTIVNPGLLLGGNPLPNPRALDMIALDNGHIAIVVGSGTTGRYWLGELKPDGSLQNWSTSGIGAGDVTDIIFLPGPVTYLAASNKGSREVQLQETTLKSPPQ